MILKIVLLSLLLIVITVVLFFLVYIFVPAVKKQTKIHENMIFSNIETTLFSVFHTTEKIVKPEKKAVVLCNCDKNFKNDSQVYKLSGVSCSVVASSKASMNDCKFSCIGLGDCKKVCPQDAIFIKNKTAIISSLCRGCGLCVNACPKNLIKLVPIVQNQTISCKNQTENLTTCSNFQKEFKISYPQKKYFKFWQSCYRILNGKK